MAGGLLRLDARPGRWRSSRRRRPKRRKEQAPPAERQSFGGEDEPAELLPEQVGRGRADRLDARRGRGGAFLLYGPTGSGKTEVYLQACAAVLERGLGAILLVPEISLAPQTVGRVRARFGDRVAILHSGLTDAERRDERERIESGEARIVVGARSAVFAPVRGLGLIVVDEEHDASYKQDSDPRYDARTIAAKRAALEGAVAVYGSATPRPESWSALERLDLGGRVSGELPPVRVVDLRREAGYPLSAPLLSELRGDRRQRRQGDSAAQPARRRARAPLPRLRRRRSAARTATSRSSCTATPGSAAITVVTPSRPRRRARPAARPSSRGSARARSGSSASSSATSPSSS